MRFKIKTLDSEVSITPEDLLIQILNQVFEDFESERSEQANNLVTAINKILSLKEDILLESTNRQLYLIYFLTGYYYKIFLTKNNVTIETTEK